MTQLRSRRARRARQKREGIVMLIVMLMLLMATGTAIFTIQATQYEQRASISIGEANWARGLAESTTLAGVAYAENTKLAEEIGRIGTGTNWTSGEMTTKYGLPVPGGGSDAVLALPIDTPPFVANTRGPGGVGRPPVGGDGGFLPGERCPLPCRYPMFRPRDAHGADPTFAPNPLLGGLTYTRPHWLMETVSVLGTGGVKVERTVITGFGEVHVWGDVARVRNEREPHEIDAMSRAYVDRISSDPVTGL